MIYNILYNKYIGMNNEKTNNEKITKEDLKPFKTIIIDINSLISNYDNIEKIIPPIYHKEYIDSFFNIKKNIRKLEIIKNFILSILESSKYELEKIEIFLDDFDINEDKFILKEKYINKFKNQSYFDNFLNKFMDKNNLFNNTKYKNIQSFNYIFQNKYNKKNKNFFSNLFRKHLKISEYLYNNIYKYQGILALDKIYELSELLILSKIDNIEKNVDIKNNIKNKLNNNYRLLGNDLNYYNKNIDTNIDNTTNTSNTNNTINPGLLPKINKFNLLYINHNNIDYYNTQYTKNINNIFNELLKIKNNLFKSNNLYSVTNNLLLLDFYNINFIFNYYDQSIFSNFIIEHINVNKIIYNKINIFENYYLDYLEWNLKKNKIKNKTITKSKDTESKSNNSFKSFYETISKNL